MASKKKQPPAAGKTHQDKYADKPAGAKKPAAKKKKK